MKIKLIFLSLIFITSNLFAQSFVCLTKNFENKDTFILLKKIDYNTYNFIQTNDLNSDDYNEFPMLILQKHSVLFFLKTHQFVMVHQLH